MWTSSIASLCSLLLLLCTVDLVSSTVILTQNVTNNADNITVFPGITIQLTCEADANFLRWQINGGSNRVVNSGLSGTITDGGFELELLSFNGSYIISTATGVSSTNTSLKCDSSGTSDTINVFIKPVVPQIDLVQNITDDSSNITICPQTPITFTCQSTTGIVIWSLDNGSNTSLSSLGETKTLGGFQLSVTNVTILLLLVESTAVISNTASDFTIACHTAVTNGLGSSIAVSVRSPPAQVSSLQLVEVCYGSISFNWTDNINSLDTPQLDYYIVSITPPTSGSTYIINDGFNTSITGLRSNQQYTVSVVPLNCAGPGLARLIQQVITTKVPPVPILSELIADTSNNSFATITVSWESGDFTDCLQSPISNYIIIVSGVLRTELIVDGVMTNTTLTVPSCGVSAVTVSARNEAGTSDRSDPIVFAGSSLTLFVSTTAVDGDSVTLSVTITQCLRSLVDNVTVTYRNEPTFGYVKTASYPNNSDSVSIALTDLQSTTQYNASVIVYYRESGRVSVLGPYPITFETTQSFFSFQEAVIIGLSVGFAVSLIIMAILVVVVFVFCYQLKQQRKKGRKLLQKFRNIAMMLRETEQNVKDLRENQTRVRPQTVGKPQENIDYHQRNKEAMETITVTNNNYEQVTPF